MNRGSDNVNPDWEGEEMCALLSLCCLGFPKNYFPVNFMKLHMLGFHFVKFLPSFWIPVFNLPSSPSFCLAIFVSRCYFLSLCPLSSASLHRYFLASSLCCVLPPPLFLLTDFASSVSLLLLRFFFQMFLSVSPFGFWVLPHTCISSLQFCFPHSPSRFCSVWFCVYLFYFLPAFLNSD